MIFIDLFLLLTMLVPYQVRRVEITDYIKVGLTVLNQTLNAQYNFQDQIDYTLLFNGQVIMLERLLNEQFVTSEPPIYIEDALKLPDNVIFNIEENSEDIWIYNNSEVIDEEEEVFIYNSDEYNTEFDFIVYVHASEFASYNMVLMKYLIDKYKLAGTRYKIESYE